MRFKLATQKYPQEGDLQHSYSALKNKLLIDNSIGDFNTEELSINLNNPLNIECQPSYDGTVNLIINDDKNPPRIINSRFTKTEDNRFKVINRNQSEQTNLYKEGSIDLQTRLFRNVTKLPRINFIDINYYGQLKGGNYTFYIKYADSDYNQTDIVCESGQVSIFKGNLSDIKSISGTLQDERTDKAIKLQLTNIDESFNKFYIYYTREYSDLNGFRLSETISITNPYDIKGSTQDIIINGFEESTLISDTELNIQYNYVTNVKTQAQVQNRLFFGNIENVNVDVKNLQNISYFIDVTLKQRDKSIGYIDPATYTSKDSSIEYYDPKNIYYNLGYWPDEIYRLGIVYIMNDDSLSPVFGLRGCEFTELDIANTADSKLQYKIQDPDTKKWNINYLERDSFLTSEKHLTNTFGVFKNPSYDLSPIQKDKQTKPWYYEISFPTFKFGEEYVDLLSELKQYGVKGYFIVRQKRIPTVLCQGVSLGIDEESSTPMLYDGNKFFTESFLNQKDGKLSYYFETRKMNSSHRKGSALLSVEAATSPILQSNLDGSPFVLQKVKDGVLSQNDRVFAIKETKGDNLYRVAKCIYLNENTPYKYVDGYGFSSRVGVAETVKEYKYFDDGLLSAKDDPKNYKLLRGVYAPYIAVCGDLESNSIYNVRVSNYSAQFMDDYFTIRRDDHSPFYAISDRYDLTKRKLDVYRGDCFTNTVTIRLNRNFTDPDYPINNLIVDSETWVKNYNGWSNTTLEKDEETDNKSEKDKETNRTGNWAKINRGDVNAVPLGMWISYKCLGNRNLGLRAEDRSYPDEEALMGNPRSFYPLQDANTTSSNKISESFILNDGYSSTVGRKNNIEAPNVPYIKDQFDNRIMFSNTQVDGDFKNAYRIFQGLSYQDIDRQYGAIVKLIPWGTNLLCVFEHGLGIVPINEKALIQTDTEQSIHMYGAGVIQNQISLITPDFGSIWPESIVRTPIGIYGVDTYAKKIWRYSDSKGFETISDMKIQRFLNDNIDLKEMDKYPIIALRNVKTHYNNNKGDVMFTFYNFSEGKEWNFCFNERMGKWITRYSWTPLYSENINNVFYSLDKKRAEVLAYIYDNKNCTYGIRTSNNQWDINDLGDLTDTFNTEITLHNVALANDFEIQIGGVSTSYILNGEEIKIQLSDRFINRNIFIEGEGLTKTLQWNKNKFESILEGIDLPYNIPLYYKIDVTVTPIIQGILASTKIRKTIGVVVDSRYNPKEYEKLLCNGFYVHGRAGIFNEIDYNDDDLENQIKPTYWYNKQEPFEFEFVVNEPVGLHKIFDNLVIISNKVEPKSIEFEIIGDVYDFKKSGLLSETEFKDEKTTIKYDPILNQKTLVVEQESKNIEKVGRRIGNIHYKEDSWYLTVEPIRFRNAKNPEWSSTRIRDKFAKIRVKYSGDSLVIITALKTLYNLSSS